MTGNKFNWRQSLFLPPFFVIIKRYIKHHEKRFRLLFVGLRGSNRGLFPWAPVEGYLVAGEGDRGNGFALARGVFLREGFARFAFGGSVAHVPQRLRAGAWSGASESRDRRETPR
jgi:hypothetical protein